MICKVFYNRLHQITPRRTAWRKHYASFAAFLRLNCKAEAQRGWGRKEALLPDHDFRPVMVEVNTLSAGELRDGFLEWREAGGSILANPLDRSQFRDFDEFTPEETLERLENYADRTQVVQSYPDGRFEAYGIFNRKTHIFIMENAPWNNPQMNAERSRKLYGTATLIWEVLFENALLENPRFWKAQQVQVFTESVVAPETWQRLQLMSLRLRCEQRQPSGHEGLTSLLHIKAFRSLVLEDAPTLAKLEKDIGIPADIMAPFLMEIRDYYDKLKQADFI